MFKAVLLFYDASMRHFFTKIKKKKTYILKSTSQVRLMTSFK